MGKINTLHQLIEQLDQCEHRNDYIKLAKNLSLDAQELSQYAFWDNNQYTRNCIKREQDYELLLLCWEKGQETPIHCHNGEECWVYLATGKIYEQRFQKDEEDQPYPVDELKMEKSGISYMNDEMGYHRLKNLADGRSMTLHLYVNPIDQCSVYSEEDQKFIFKDLHYYSTNGILNKEIEIEN